MIAFLLSDYKNLDVVDFEKPSVDENDVLVQVKDRGVCWHDIHDCDGSSGRRIPPLVMRHEAAGVVDEVGSNIFYFVDGDRVAFDSTVSCGVFVCCDSGRIGLRDNRVALDISCGDDRRHGAFSKFVLLSQHIYSQLPKELAFTQSMGQWEVRAGDSAYGLGTSGRRFFLQRRR